MSKGFTINHHHISLFRWICLYLFKSSEFSIRICYMGLNSCTHNAPVNSHMMCVQVVAGIHMYRSSHTWTYSNPCLHSNWIGGQRALELVPYRSCWHQDTLNTYITFLHRFHTTPSKVGQFYILPIKLSRPNHLISHLYKLGTHYTL